MPRPAPGPIELLRAEIALDRAKAAARAGKLAEAEQSLTGLATTELEPSRLDCLARVYAQRGQLDEADACWTRVQAIDPENRAATRGRAEIAVLRGRPWRRRVNRLALVALVVGAALAIVVAALLWPTSHRPTNVAAGSVSTSPSTHPSPSLPPRHQPASPTQKPGPTQSPAAHALARALSSAGVRARADGASVRITFDRGLFSSDDLITPQGEALLHRLGGRLAGRHGRITVVGHAVAVAGGPSSGGSVVGFARAAVAANELSAASGWPLTAFTLRAADQADGPFPDPARNRTVTLVVTS
jgi:hypothetical protein